MKHTFVILTIILFAACYGRKPEKTGLEGKPIPSVDLLLPDSSTHLNSGRIPTDKPVVIFLFGPHCPYSHAQMEEIIEEIDVLKDIQFCIVTSGPFAQMKEFYDHYNLKNYHNIITGLDYKRSFADYFKIPGVPYIAIYGKDKIMKKAFLGKVYGSQIKVVAEE